MPPKCYDGIVDVLTFSPVNPNLMPGVDHHEIYLLSHLPLYDICGESGLYVVHPFEEAVIAVMLVSG